MNVVTLEDDPESLLLVSDWALSVDSRLRLTISGPVRGLSRL